MAWASSSMYPCKWVGQIKQTFVTLYQYPLKPMLGCCPFLTIYSLRVNFVSCYFLLWTVHDTTMNEYILSLSSSLLAFLTSVLLTTAMQSIIQAARLLLKNGPTLAHASVKISLTQNASKHSFPCCAVKSCPLVNYCDLLTGISDFYLPFFHLTLSLRRCPRATGFIFSVGKLE